MKYYVFTFGCQMNKSDSERIASLLEGIGYKPASKTKEADLIVVNMCSVRQSAVDRIFGLAPKFEKLKKERPKLKTILTGCILKEDQKKFSRFFDLILKIKELPYWPQFLEKKKSSLEKKHCQYFKIQPKRVQKDLAFVPISNGCNNFCSYCVVPFTRGKLICRSYQEILREVKEAVSSGAKEIWLLGQNVNDYECKNQKAKGKNIEKYKGVGIKYKGVSIKYKAKLRGESEIINFAKLVKMVEGVSGNFKFFFTSPHPKNFSDELIEVLAECKKFGKLLNLPVQSGDNQILKKMNRNYTVQEYKNLVKKIREKIPDIKLSTDVIVGFPGETKKQFENTVKLFKEIKFDQAYIAKYSLRPGTLAFKTMEDNVPLIEKRKREKILREILKSN